MIEKARLAEKCSTWNIDLTPEQLEQLDRYAQILVEYNQNVNLTGTVERIIQEKTGYTLEMLLSDGERVSYTVDSTVSEMR